MARETGTHPVNTAHLVMGLVFAGIVAVWSVVAAGTVDTTDLRWLIPLPFLFAGGAGLVVFAVGRTRRTPSDEETAGVDDVTADDPDYMETRVISDPR